MLKTEWLTTDEANVLREALDGYVTRCERGRTHTRNRRSQANYEWKLFIAQTLLAWFAQK